MAGKIYELIKWGALGLCLPVIWMSCSSSKPSPTKEASESKTGRPEVSAANRLLVAHEFFLRARHQEWKGNHTVALSFYQIASEYDPDSRDLCFIVVDKFKRAGLVDSALAKADRCLSLDGNVQGDEYKTIGELYLREGELRKSLEYYEKASAIDEGDRDLLYTMATIYETLNENDKQVKVLEKLVPRVGYPLRLVEKLALAYLQDENPVKVEKLYQRAWESTGNSRFGEKLAQFYEQQKMYQKLLGTLRQLAKADDEQVMYHVQIARTHLILGQQDSAIAIYSELAEKHPEDEQYLFNHASLLFEIGNYEKAKPLFAKLLRKNPENAVYHFFMGSVATELKNNDLAEIELRKAITLDSAVPEYWAKLAFYYIENDKSNKSLELLEKMTSSYPENWYAWYLRGVAVNQVAYDLEKKLNKVSEPRAEEIGEEMHDLRSQAVENFEKALSLDDQKVRVQFDLGVTLEKLQRKKEAIDVLKKVVSADTTNAVAANYLGYMLVEDNRELKFAGKLIDRALELEPENGAYLDSKGWWHYRRRNYEKAKEYLEKAMEKVPSDTTILEHYALVLEKLGQKNLARQQWRLILKLDPKHQLANQRTN